ncbi:MAG: hypothetical protein LBD67_03245 [Candidatus Accumulibacter sp.]|jgi:hypothetical protein|nr:hypothetical protein [Accumulibacter sp.]
MAFPILTLSSNSFSILTLRQAQGERIEKQVSDKLNGRTDWKTSLWQASFVKLRTSRMNVDGKTRLY